MKQFLLSCLPFCLGSTPGNILQGERWFHNVNSRASEEYNFAETGQKGAFISLRVWMKWGNSFVFIVGPWLKFCLLGLAIMQLWISLSFDWWLKVVIFLHTLALKCCWHIHSAESKCQDLALSGPAMFPAPVVHLGLVGSTRFHFWPTIPEGSRSRQGLPL